MGIKALPHTHDRRCSFFGNFSFYCQSIHHSGRGILRCIALPCIDYRDGLGVFEKWFFVRQTGYTNGGQHANAKFIPHNEAHTVSTALYFMNGMVSSKRAGTLDKDILGLPHPNGLSKRCSVYTSTWLARSGLHSARAQ